MGSETVLVLLAREVGSPSGSCVRCATHYLRALPCQASRSMDRVASTDIAGVERREDLSEVRCWRKVDDFTLLATLSLFTIRSVDVYSEVVECSERVLTSYRTYRIRTVLYRITTAGRVMTLCHRPSIKLSTTRNDVFIE